MRHFLFFIRSKSVFSR